MLEVRGELEGTGKAALNPNVEWKMESVGKFAASTNGKVSARV
jgi:hypothetical protein